MALVSAPDIRTAPRRSELMVVYQPQIDLKTATIAGVEALVRWQHPRHGMLGPASFLPAAEQSAAIVDIDDFVLRQACVDLRAWQHHGFGELRVAANLSVRSLEDPTLPTRVASALADASVLPERLEVEITESAAVRDADMILDAISTVRRTGVRVALDDFGTGYAMLERLRSMPFDALKIDRSFVAGLRETSGPQLLLAAIAMGQGLGLRVVAEGVEDDAQLAFLNRHRCDEAQGYLLGRPMTASDLLIRLGEQHAELLEVDPADVPGPFGSGDAALERLVRPLLREVARLTDLESTYLTYIDRVNGMQAIIYARNTGDLQVGEGLQISWRDTVCKRSLETGLRCTSDVQAVFGDSPAARALGLQSYVGVPVLGGDGEVWGTLCGASTEERSVGDSTVSMMDAFARLVSSQLELNGWESPTLTV